MSERESEREIVERERERERERGTSTQKCRECVCESSVRDQKYPESCIKSNDFWFRSS